MRVRGTGSATVERYESQAEFQAQLARAESYLVLGQEIDHPEAFFIVRFETGSPCLESARKGTGSPLSYCCRRMAQLGSATINQLHLWTLLMET